MKRAFTSLLILLTLCIQLASTSPELHQWLHAGTDHACSTCNSCSSHQSADDQSSDQEAHQCAVNLMATGIALIIFEIQNPFISYVRIEAETFEYTYYLNRVDIFERNRDPPILS